MKRRIYNKLLSSGSGTAAVEFALVITPVLFLIFGIVELGRYFWTSNAIERSAIVAVRCISISSDECVPGNEGGTLESKTASYLQKTANDLGVTLIDFDDGNIKSGPECFEPHNNENRYWFINVQYTFNALFVPFSSQTISIDVCFPNQDFEE